MVFQSRILKIQSSKSISILFTKWKEKKNNTKCTHKQTHITFVHCSNGFFVLCCVLLEHQNTINIVIKCMALISFYYFRSSFIFFLFSYFLYFSTLMQILLCIFILNIFIIAIDIWKKKKEGDWRRKMREIIP